MFSIDALLTLSDRFCTAQDVQEKTLSFWVFGDSKKLKALRDGADITTARFNNAVHWFARNWPSDLPWPEGVERPAANAANADALPADAPATEGAAA